MIDSRESWIATLPLRNVAQRLLTLRKRRRNVTGTMLAILTRRLIMCEQVVGGPYVSDDGCIDPEANRALALFFLSYGIRLPSLEPFLENSSTLGRQESTAIQKNPTGNDVRGEVCLYPEAIRVPALRLWKKILSADNQREITGISAYFYESLCVTRAMPLSDPATIGMLARGNFYAWMAYTVYDDFIDEDGAPADLPVANIMHRSALSLYEGAGKVAAKKCFYDMDAANAWELAHCRFPVANGVIIIGMLPDYGDLTVLSRRAGAHTLGPQIVAGLVGLTAHDKLVVKRALSHYLIAHQLNDDLHDWVDDLNAGHISPVVAHLLRVNKTAFGPHNLPVLIKRLKRLFWNGELDTLCQQAEGHIAAARVLESCHIIDPDSPYTRQIIAPLQAALAKSRRTHADHRQFLKVYTAALHSS